MNDTIIDWTKPVRTKKGKLKVTVLSTKAAGAAPVVGQIEFLDNRVFTWTLNGVCLPKTVWADVENYTPPVEATRRLVWREYPNGHVSCSVAEPAWTEDRINESAQRGGYKVKIEYVHYKSEE